MARLIMHWTLMCSDCEKYIELSPADKVPKTCPHCQAEFEQVSPGGMPEDSDKKSTFVPPIEKMLQKVADKL